MALESSNIFSTPDDDEEMPTSTETTSTGGPIDLWGTPEVKDTYRGKLHTVDPFFCSDFPMMGSKRESTPLDQGEGSNLVSSDVDEVGASYEGDGDQANNEQDFSGKEKAQDASRVKNIKKGAKKRKKVATHEGVVPRVRVRLVSERESNHMSCIFNL